MAQVRLPKCDFYAVCIMAGDGCEKSQEENCQLYSSIKKDIAEILKHDCPLMTDLKYKGESRKCNIPHYRATLKPGNPCHQYGQCSMSFLPEAQRLAITRSARV